MGEPKTELSWARRPGTPTLVIEVRLGPGMQSPADLVRSVARAMGEYAATPALRTPFLQQPGIPAGTMKSDGQAPIGHWEIKEITP